MIAKVSTDSHKAIETLIYYGSLRCSNALNCVYELSARDLTVCVKDCKSSPDITHQRAGEVEDNTLPVISYNKIHKTSKFLFTFSYYFL